MTQARDGTAGYTLLELLVVIALIGLVAAIAAPASIRAVEGARLNGDARALVSEIRELQAAAQNEGKRPVLLAGPGGVLLASGDALALPNGSAARMVGPNREIVFYEDGTVSEGHIRLEYGDRRVEVRVAWLTGETEIEAVP